MNNFSGEKQFSADNYSENAKNWQKSVSEYVKFILDHLEKFGFVEHLLAAEDDSNYERWQTRQAELLEKATRRIGYHIEENELKIKAYKEIIKQKNNGELPDSKFLDRFIIEVTKILPELL